MIHSDMKKISFEELEDKYPGLIEVSVDQWEEKKLELRQETRRKNIKKNKMKRYIKSRVLLLIICLVIVLNISVFVLQLIKINGVSMEPTLMEGSHKIINKIAYINKGPQRFDVIVFELIEGSDYNYVKRVIGLPGETVRIEQGSIFIDGKQLLDPILGEVYESLYAKNEITLGEDEYFVLGDNREFSLDSRDRNFGNVSGELIIGKIL